MPALPSGINAGGPLGLDDTSYLVFTAELDGQIQSEALDNMPTDFATMDSPLSMSAIWLHNGVDDTITVRMRIINGGTILAAADSGGTFQQIDQQSANGEYSPGPVQFGFVNTTADKATWDGATLEIQQGYTAEMKGDNAQLQLDWVELSGSYTASTPPIAPKPATQASKGVLYRDGSNLWGFAPEVDETADARSVPEALKSVDDGANWTQPDAHTDNPNAGAGVLSFLATDRSGNKVAMAWFDTSDDTCRYSVFDISTELWTVESEQIVAATNVGGATGGLALKIRSDNTVVVALEDDNDVEVYIRTQIDGGGSWGSLISVHTGTAEIHGVDMALEPTTDDLHITWCGYSGNANLYHRRLDGGDDSLGTLQTSTVASVGTLNSWSQVEIYFGWLYQIYTDGSNVAQVRRAKVADVPSTWTTETLSTAAATGSSAIPMGLVQADGQLFAHFLDLGESLVWSRGPYFGIETDTNVSVTTTDTNLTLGLVERQVTTEPELHMYLVDQDGTVTDHQALGLASGGGSGDLPFEANDSGIDTIFTSGGRNIYTIEESSSTPLIHYVFGIIDHDSAGPLEMFFVIHKSMDGVTWWRSRLETDTERTDNNRGYVNSDVMYDGTDFHVASGVAGTDNTTADAEIRYWNYDPVAESYSPEKEVVADIICTINPEITVQARSDGSVVLAYTKQRTSGSSDIMLAYKIRSTGGVWGSELTLEDPGAANTVRYPASVIGASERIHFLYGLTTGTAEVRHRSLSSGDTPDTAQTVTSGTVRGSSIQVAYNGTSLMVIYESATRDRDTKTASSGADPTWSGADDVDDAAYANLDGITDLAFGFDTIDGNWIAVSPRNASPHDIYKDKNTGGGWGTDEDTGQNTLPNIDQFGSSPGAAYTTPGGNFEMLVMSQDFGVAARIHTITFAFGTTFQQSMSGAIANTSLTGDLSNLPKKQLAGTITPAGSLVRSVSKTLVGSISSSGATIKSIAKALAGTITPSGLLSLIKSKTISLAGSISPSGALSDKVGKAFTGDVTPAGAITKGVSKAIAGTVSPAGSVSRKIAALITGSISSTGQIVKSVGKILTGSITPTGTLSRKIAIIFDGTVTPVGEITSKILKSFAGSISPTGALSNFVPGGTTFFRTFTGAISTMTGAVALSTAKTIDGAITPTGDLGPMTVGKRIAGTITPESVLRKYVAHLLDGTITPAGSIISKVMISIGGTLTSAGSVSTNVSSGTVFRTFTGAITSTGELFLKVGRTIEGTIAPSGSYGPQTVSKGFSGSITPAGTVSTSRRAVIVLSGAITGLSGVVVRKASKGLSGAISPASTVTRKVMVRFVGTITPQSALRRKISRSFSAAITLTGTVATQVFSTLAGPVIARIFQQGRTNRRIHGQDEEP